jgi:hypothetical protein
MPFDDFGTNPLMQDYSALQGLSPNTFPTNADSALGNTPMGLSGLSGSSNAPPPSMPSAMPAQAPPQQQSPGADLSGNVKEPSFWELVWPGALGGPAGVDFNYQKIINQRARPIASNLMQEFSKALNSGDYDRATEATLGMSQLAGKVPMFGKAVDSMTATLNDRRTKTEQNNSYLDIVSAVGKDNPDLMQAVGALRTKASVMPMELTRKSVEDMFPQLTSHNGYTTAINKITGETKVTQTPTMLDIKDFTPEEKEQYQIAGVNPIEVVNTANKISAGKGSWEDFQKYMGFQQTIQQRLSSAYANKVIPPALRLQYGMEPGQAQEQAGVPGAGGMQAPPQGGMQPNAPQAGVSPLNQLVGAFAKTEGSGDQAVSSKGAIGRFQILPETAMEFMPGVSKEQATELLKSPQVNEVVGRQIVNKLYAKYQGRLEPIATEYFSGPKNVNPDGSIKNENLSDGINTVRQYVDRFKQMMGTPQTTTQKLVSQRIGIQAQEKSAETGAAEVAKKQEEPTDKAHTFWLVDPKTSMPVEYQGPRLSQNQVSQAGLYTSQEATETKYLREFRGRYEQGQKAFEAIKALPDDVINSSSNLKSIFNHVAATGVSIPFKIPLFAGAIGNITIPGMGSVALTQKEAAAYNILVGTAQNVVEPFLNKGGANSEQMQAIKASVYGAFSNKDSALTTIKSALEQGWTDAIGRMKSAQGSGANNAQMPKLEFTPSSQGGAAQTLQGQESKAPETIETPTDFLRYALKSLANLPENITYLAKRRDLPKDVKDYIQNLTETGAGPIGAYLKWNKEAEDKAKAEKEAAKVLKENKQKRSQGPVNPGTLKSLTGFQ